MKYLLLVLVLVTAVTRTAEGASPTYTCEARTTTPYEGYDDWLSVEARCRKAWTSNDIDFERVRMRVRLGRRIGGPNDSFTLHLVHRDRKEGDESLGAWAQIGGWELHRGGQRLAFLTGEQNRLTSVFRRLIDGNYHSARVGSYSSHPEFALAYGDTMYHYSPHWPPELHGTSICLSSLDPRLLCTEDTPCQLTFHYALYRKEDFVTVRQMIEMASDNTRAVSRLRAELEREQAQRVAGLRDSVLSLKTEYSEVKRNRDELQKQLQMQEECDENAVRGDFNGDGRVNFSDFLIFVGLYEADN